MHPPTYVYSDGVVLKEGKEEVAQCQHYMEKTYIYYEIDLDMDLTPALFQHYYIPSLCCHTNGWSS